MLEQFSVAKIYNIVFRAIALASKSYLENGITKKHVTKLIIRKLYPLCGKRCSHMISFLIVWSV